MPVREDVREIRATSQAKESPGGFLSLRDCTREGVGEFGKRSSALSRCPVSPVHSAISVELYYIFATVWGREQYTLYGILFFVFAILLSVGACISIALTYFQLSGEDYRWWWRSVLSVGSTGLFIFLYSVFYYARRSNMSGAVQTVEFFGYSLLTGYVFFLMLGTISFFSSLKFIRYIYVNLKMD